VTQRPRTAAPSAVVPRDCLARRAIQAAHQGIHRSLAVQLAERALGGEECASDPSCFRHAVLTLVYAGDLPSAEAHCAAALARPEWRAEFTVLHARIRYLAGDCAVAREMVAGALRAPPPDDLAWLVEILIQRDELALAESLLESVPGGALAAHAAVQLASNRFELAVDGYLACGRELVESGIANPAVVAWRSRAALAALATRRVDLALALADDELVAARRWGSPATVGAALHPVALLRTDIDLLADAVRLLDLARARNEQIWALHDLGLLLRKRRDRGAARAKLLLADRLARRGGNVRWSRRIRPVLENLPAPGATAPLTRQETRVARLAAAGHTNRQIAEKLSLTLRTVEFHLSGVYRKLGISGRRELSAVLAALF
jgi:DNA-binding CsgD family transcriptional regulator